MNIIFLRVLWCLVIGMLPEILSARYVLRQQSQLFFPKKEPQCMIFSPDGSMIALWGDRVRSKTIELFNGVTGERMFSFQGHTENVHVVAFSHDGTYLVSASSCGEIKIWSLLFGQEVCTIVNGAVVSTVALTADNNRILVAGDNGQLREWHIAYPFLACSVQTFIRSFVASFALSLDNRYVATGLSRGHIFVWDTLENKNSIYWWGHTESVHHIAFLPDGETIVSASHDGLVKVWQRQTGNLRETLTPFTAPICSLACEQAQILVGTRNGIVSSFVDAAFNKNFAAVRSLRVRIERASDDSRNYTASF